MTGPGPVARAGALAALGHAAPPTAAESDAAVAGLTDPDRRVRAAALGALVRTRHPSALDAWCRSATDDDSAVRRRTAELAPALGARDTVVPALVAALGDDEVTVVEAAAWALGELGRPEAVEELARVATRHRDALAREAAVAALGAIGDARGLPAVLLATRDKPAVRRRAVLALAPFDGPEVDAALAGARVDKDWQVRQAAEDLSGTE